ncbi:prepilin-type N-terminal cleavage/methylation domain-containing protein [Boseongicola sp. H5]|uniref:type IV pilus modification PilV family protein n=1 Tax=Rhodobacterales TaxID=204455 RepID=UPI001B1C5D45|nr:prepilin-type N-terminal cleavage/methylation domain-containing protein [Boseongicola sp. H5]MBO6603898.1 prepilin-type N-terminal cleavage/methylation domain-containing protein [Roseicyclus sp.]MBO6624858.1 prepilin-type N-terminal cleavage/methylation domain-containing protein [Roseicyclus sp.]MBO6924189.1 prepilin-type N-terminal cleavage/methylation domain-containing protein [Roseicyclus sp.]
MSRRAGYSVLEVLVAFAVMAMVFAVLIPGQSALLGRTITADERLLATDFAASRMDAIGITGPITPGISEDRYRDWIVSERRLLQAAPADTLTLISVTIEIRSAATGDLIASLSAARVAE